MATDSFTNTNGTALETHDSTWIYNATEYEIRSNGVRMNGTGDTFAAWNGTFDPDQYSELTVASLVGANYVGVGVRIQDADSGYGFYGTGNTNDNWLVYMTPSGSWSQLGASAGSAAFATSDVIRISIESETITPTINGSTTGTPGAQTHSEYSSGLPGLFFAGGNNNARGDDWVGLDLAADVVEEPLLGELDLTGQAPGIFTEIGVPAGTLDTDGLLPTISLAINIAVPAGSLTIDTTGTVPTAEITHTRQIPAVTPLLITPAAPSAEITHIRGPPQGELALTGQLPTIAITISVPVPLGELDLLGLASSANVTHNRAVPAGSASLTGLTETLDTAYGVPADALALAGLLPTISVDSGAVVEEPPAGALALTGLVPTVEITHIRQVPAGSLSLAGQTPDAGGAITIAVAKGELVIFTELGLRLRGITPTIEISGGNVIEEPPAGSLLLAGLAPSAEQEHTRQVPAGTLALTGLAPSAEKDHVRQVPAGSLALAGLQPSAETEHTRQVPAGSAALTGQLPTISVGVGSATAEPLLGSLTLAGKTPALEIIISNADSSLFFTGQAPTPLQNASPPDIITSPGDGSLTLAGLVPERASGLLLTGLAPTVLGDRQVLPEDGALTLTGLTPTVFGENPTIEVPVGALSINGLQPFLPDFVAPGTGALTLTGLQPRFEGPQQASPPPDNLVLTGYAPTIVVPTPGKAKAGGRRRGRKPRKFSIEIDGELFVVNTVMEAIDLLRVAKQEAKTAPLPVKKPRIRIVGTASKTARLEVERAQRVVSRTFSKRLDAEIAGLMRESEARQKANTARIKRGMVRAKKRAADDEEAIAVLLLLS